MFRFKTTEIRRALYKGSHIVMLWWHIGGNYIMCSIIATINNLYVYMSEARVWVTSGFVSKKGILIKDIRSYSFLETPKA